MFSYEPFGDVAIRVAAVVDETCDASLFCCIEILVLLKHHKVKVGYALVVVAPHAFLEILRFDDFANVLVHKGLCRDGPGSTQAESLLVGLDDLDVCILPALEALVLAVFCTAAIGAEAFGLGEAIDASCLFCTCPREVVATGAIVALAYEPPLVSFAAPDVPVCVPVLVEGDKGG